jgi:predicted MFS family arabinose efflux permease
VATDGEPGTHVEGVAGVSVHAEPAPPAFPAGVRPLGAASRFFAATFLSLYGDWLTTVALLVVLFEATNNPAAPAGYMVVRVAPRVMGPWWGGRIADQISPRVVLTAALGVQAILTFALITLHRSGLIWGLYVVVAVAQFLGAVGRPSQAALLPSLVSQRNLPRANATYGLFLSTSLFVAPAIGALLLVRVGPDALFAIDGATFAISALLIATLPGHTDGHTATATQRTVSILRAALRQRRIRVVLAAFFASGLIPTVTQAFLVVAAHERFGGDAAVGYLYSSVGVGGVLGGLIALRWIPQRTWTRFGVLTAVTIELVATAGFSASSGVQVALLLLAVSAIAGSSLDTWGVTEVQRSAPPGLMARYNSLVFVALYSGMLVGALWALATASVLHWDSAIEFACAAMLTLMAVVWVMGGDPGAVPSPEQP